MIQKKLICRCDACQKEVSLDSLRALVSVSTGKVASKSMEIRVPDEVTYTNCVHVCLVCLRIIHDFAKGKEWTLNA